MRTMKSVAAIACACAIAIAACAGPDSALAQVVDDSACPKYAVDIASFATSDGDRVARDESEIQRVSSQGAFSWTLVAGKDALLIDIRSRAEIAFVGMPAGVDVIVPFAEIAQPLHWDPSRRDLQLVSDPRVVATVEAHIARKGGDRKTPLLLICRSGERAATAAQLLQNAGLERVVVVKGGFEGNIGADGRRRGGWKDAGLPWFAKTDAALMFSGHD
jgi:rhodanese-related sulfurtransferase